jgi:hypothetical protein
VRPTICKWGCTMKKVWRMLTDRSDMWHGFAVRWMILVGIGCAVIMSACFIP